MKKIVTALVGALALGYLTQALASDTLQKSCAADIQNFCSNVTLPSDIRRLSCLFAHEDRLQGACRYALYDGVSMLSNALMRIDTMKKACESDIAVHCGKDSNGAYDLNACLKTSYPKFSLECQRTVDGVDPKHH